LRAELIGNTKMAVHAYTSLGIANPNNDKIPEEENILICQFWINSPDGMRQGNLNTQMFQIFSKICLKKYLKKFYF
jgi:hypothetical protein